MLSYKLINLIQYHSEKLTSALLTQVQSSARAESYRNVSPAELKERVSEIYHHLGAWLTDTSERDIERRYMAIGARRSIQKVPLSEVVWVIVLTKQNLREFVDDVSFPGRFVETSERQELLDLLDRFFDLAIYSATAGYEQAIADNAKRRRVLRKAS
ncbi:MAG TPA: hypothetical protein VKR59_07300 [Terriglobales bacterium]|nr:hypothetical protein [Terriglobales bacterium]